MAQLTLLCHSDRRSILCIISISCILCIVCISCLIILLIIFIIFSIFIIFIIFIFSIFSIFVISIYVLILYKYLLYLPLWKKSSVQSIILTIKSYLIKTYMPDELPYCVSWLIGTKPYLLYPWLLFIVKVISTYWVWP